MISHITEEHFLEEGGKSIVQLSDYMGLFSQVSLNYFNTSKNKCEE